MSLRVWLFTRTPVGNQVTLECMVAPFSFKKGRGSTNNLVLETSDVRPVGVGYVDFRDDQVHLMFKPQALQPAFIRVCPSGDVRITAGLT